jgi:ABC-2 type transport system permease protein
VAARRQGRLRCPTCAPRPDEEWLYPALVIARARAEEAGGRAELLLSTPATRTAWVGAHAGIAALGTLVLLAAGGLTTGLAVSAGSGGETAPVPALAATLLQVPAAWVLGGLTLLVLGVVPRATAAVAWAGFLFVQLFELVGPIAGIDFRIVEWIIPYFHLPRILTGDPLTPWPLIALAAVTAILGMAGITALRRRDLAPTT